MPHRISLVEQVAHALRRDLLAGRWRDQLPGEHQLSDLFQVSRSTLRLSLGILQREGWVRASRGQRRRIVRPARRTPASTSTVIGLISPLPLREHFARSLIIVDELRRLLQDAGYTLQLHVVPQSSKRVGGGRLQALVDGTRAACWILWSCSREVQRWFAERSLPALVQGSCHEGIDLPFFRVDGGAACHHATARLYRLGHRDIALLLPRSPFAGAREIQDSFHRACGEFRGLPRAPLIRYLEGGVPEIERTLVALLRAHARPSALIVMMPTHALTVCSYLLREGFHLPQDISLVAILDDLCFDHLTPTLTRYGFNQWNAARRILRLILSLVQSGARPRSITIYPDFLNGSTHGPLGAEAAQAERSRMRRPRYLASFQ